MIFQGKRGAKEDNRGGDQKVITLHFASTPTNSESNRKFTANQLTTSHHRSRRIAQGPDPFFHKTMGSFTLVPE
jgi:hypothetical protein